MPKPFDNTNIDESDMVISKTISASLDRMGYSSREFLYAGPLPVNKGRLFYMSSR